MAQDTWQSCLAQHGPALVLLARQWARCHADAEDIVQEAFVRFWRSAPVARNQVAYLYASVRNAAIDAQRAARTRLRHETSATAVRPEALFAAPDGAIARAELTQAVLESLSHDQREVLVMKIWGGLTFDQIARALAIPQPTAASRYRVALGNLRQHPMLEAAP